MQYELHLPPERPQYNLRTGQFLPGHIPHNKGKKWSDYMDGRTARRLRRLIRDKLPHTGNPNLPGCNARPIAAFDDDDKFIGWFASANDAERKTGICARNIINVLHGKRKHAGGYKWIYDNNSIKK